jgi:hypothetical protein
MPTRMSSTWEIVTNTYASNLVGLRSVCNYGAATEGSIAPIMIIQPSPLVRRSTGRSRTPLVSDLAVLSQRATKGIGEKSLWT